LSGSGYEQIFETTLIQRINDINTGGPDLSVYLLADELPTWVYINPIAKFTDAEFYALDNSIAVPMLAISQGNWSSGPPSANTLHGPVAYIVNSNLSELTAPRSSFLHTTVTGDSGTQVYTLINNNLFLYKYTCFINLILLGSFQYENPRAPSSF